MTTLIKASITRRGRVRFRSNRRQHDQCNEARLFRPSTDTKINKQTHSDKTILNKLKQQRKYTTYTTDKKLKTEEQEEKRRKEQRRENNKL